jgi:maltose alpha-D-glucosyltransferase/alpha-amylase
MSDNDPLWYKDAIFYELHVRSFHDGVGDGMGDFRGLAQKLDYLQDLGLTAVWLLPFYPSPLRDDGYDIADYTAIHPHYGKLSDFQAFLHAAHERGLRVITELVINHTSDQHPWFQRARHSPPGSPERDFFVWSDTPEKYREARIIFKDFERSNWTWDPEAKVYYWHRFYSHQPDLNYDNPAVWDAIFPVVDFWMDMGVDGMRLDAVPYLYEREGTSCENLPETHRFLKALRQHVDEKFPHRMLLAEANQWPEDASSYFGDGDECHMAFHFPVMPRLFMAIHMEDRFPILDIMAQTPRIPDNYQWGLFLRNHDELTLEMVTDEERDYMYRAYASDPRARINLGIRHRLAPLLGNNRRRIELMNGLLLSLPGTPVLYYGDEIGMGDNIYLGDRNGVRTPMQWSADRNAGFSRANPQKLFLPVIIDPEYHYEAVNVEAQQNNPNSLLWWMKRLIALRRRYQAFGRGTLEFLQPRNRKVLAFLRRFANECLLVVANLSRFVQHVELDLSAMQGLVPVEMFGHTSFPRIGKQPYTLTLGPHGFYWFSLETSKRGVLGDLGPVDGTDFPVVKAPQDWRELFHNPGNDRLEEALAAYLAQRPWFGDHARVVRSVAIAAAFPVHPGPAEALVTLIKVEFNEGLPVTFLVPVTLARRDQSAAVLEHYPWAIIAGIENDDGGILYDALANPGFCNDLLEAIRRGQAKAIPDAELVAQAILPQRLGRECEEAPGGGAPGRAGSPPPEPPPFVCQEQQSNTSVIFGNQLILKVFRRLEEGVNPDLEVGRYLATRISCPPVAPLVGAIEYCPRRSEAITLAVLHRYVANEGTAWQYVADELSRFFERILTLSAEEQHLPRLPASPLEVTEEMLPPFLKEQVGRALEFARLLGLRSAEMHLALATAVEDPAFAPEPFTTLYQRSLYQSLRNQCRRAFDLLRERLDTLSEEVRAAAQDLLGYEDTLLRRWRTLLNRKVNAQRTRYHGDYHLGEVLYTGKDFVIIDFEGSPARSINDRRQKRSPLRDIASMIRSFHYASFSALHSSNGGRVQLPGIIRAEDRAVLKPWALAWYLAVSTLFLRSYLTRAAEAVFLPRSADELKALFEAFLLDKAIAELGHELKNRPNWVGIPLQGLLELLRPSS